MTRETEQEMDGFNADVVSGRLERFHADEIFFATLQKVTPHQPKPRISRTKGRASKRTTFVRDIVKEVAG